MKTQISKSINKEEVMEFLKMLESIRNPVLDAIFSAITMLGEETLFIVVGLVFFWCISKKQGYYILSIGFFGTVVNQFLKLWFRIPRPWVRDPEFTIVESARAEATGYSFPSGHTQISVGTFGAIAHRNKQLWVRIASIAVCVLVPLSRMYLGVHTPADVLVSIGVALVLIFGFYPIFNKAAEKPKYMRILFGVMLLCCVAHLGFVSFYQFPADIDAENLSHGISNGYKMLGCVLGIILAFEVDTRVTKFDTKAVWWAQLLKLGLGLIPILLIKGVLKAPLLALFNGHDIAGAVRYFLLTAFAGAVWPMTFKWFAKLGK